MEAVMKEMILWSWSIEVAFVVSAILLSSAEASVADSDGQGQMVTGFIFFDKKN